MKNDPFELYEIELEMQNKEIQSSKALLEDTLDIFVNLYDYAAVPCLSFDEKGIILEMNLTGAEFLNEPRDCLVGKPFSAYLSSQSKIQFFNHIKRLRDGTQKLHTKLEVCLKGNVRIPVVLISKSVPVNLKSSLNFSHQSVMIDLRDFEKDVDRGQKEKDC